MVVYHGNFILKSFNSIWKFSGWWNDRCLFFPFITITDTYFWASGSTFQFANVFEVVGFLLCIYLMVGVKKQAKQSWKYFPLLGWNPPHASPFRCHPPYRKPPKGCFCPIFFTSQLNLYIIIGLMRKDTVRSSKLRELRDFKILVRNQE